MKIWMGRHEYLENNNSKIRSGSRWISWARLIFHDFCVAGSVNWTVWGWSKGVLKSRFEYYFWVFLTWRKLAGRSRTADIFWSLRWRARSRPFVSLCLAVSDRMWSSNVNVYYWSFISKIKSRTNLFRGLFSCLTNSNNKRSFILRELLDF